MVREVIFMLSPHGTPMCEKENTDRTKVSKNSMIFLVE